MKTKLYQYIKFSSIFVLVVFYKQGFTAEESPFVTEPLHLTSITKTIGGKTAFPNVMLLVDDSGSMGGSIGRPRKSKMRVVKESLMAVLKKYDPENPTSDSELDENGNVRQIHWNMMSLCASFTGNRSCAGSRMRTPASWNGYLTSAEMQQFVPLLRQSGGTPTTMRYLQAAELAAQEMNYSCQKNFIVVLSDGDANGNEGPFTTRAYANFVLKDVYGDLPGYWNNRRPGNAPRTGPYGFDPGEGLSFFSHKLKDMDFKTSGLDVEGSEWEGKQNIETFTVGFGTGLSDSGLRYLQNGGAADEVDGSPVKTYFNAETPDELVKAFNQIFTTIDEKSKSDNISTTSVAAPATASSSILSYTATLSLDTGKWNSEIHFNKLDDNGQPVKQPGGNAYIFYSPDYTSERKFLVSDGNRVDWLKNNSWNRELFGFAGRNARDFQYGLLPWISRDINSSDAEIEEEVSNRANAADRLVKEYRVRTPNANDNARQMGDVLDASVLSIGEENKYIVTGANDGMVYIFRASTDYRPIHPYDLILNYLPLGMEREGYDDTLGTNLKKIAEADYGSPDNPHIYGVNGGITYFETADAGDRYQRTLLLGAMGQGGRGVYALNISGCERRNKNRYRRCTQVGLDKRSNDWKTSVPAWESAKGNGNLLGYTIGKPILYPIAENWENDTPKLDTQVFLAGFVANGYQTKDKTIAYDQKPTLYVYNALGEDLGLETTYPRTPVYGVKGEVISKLTASTADGPGALASPSAVDIDFNGIVDVVYAGDQYGDLYRFDLRGERSSNNWKVTKIFDGDPTRPITSAPAIYRQNDHSVIVAFGTGSDLYEIDRKDQDIQGFYGIYDDLDEPSPETLTENELAKRSFVNADQNTRTISPATSPIDEGKKGWWFELGSGMESSTSNTTVSITSEQVVNKPQILLQTVFFTTRIYKDTITSASDLDPTKTETCKVSEEGRKTTGTSWLMGVDVTNGGQVNPNETATITVRKDDGTFEANTNAGTFLGALASAPMITGEYTQVIVQGSLSAFNYDGMVTEGTSTLGTEVTPNKNNKSCEDEKKHRLEVALGQKEDSLYSSDIGTPACQPPPPPNDNVKSSRLIRINTREIR